MRGCAAAAPPWAGMYEVHWMLRWVTCLPRPPGLPLAVSRCATLLLRALCPTFWFWIYLPSPSNCLQWPCGAGRVPRRAGGGERSADWAGPAGAAAMAHVRGTACLAMVS